MRFVFKMLVLLALLFVIGGAAIYVYRWGRPLPQILTPVAHSDRNGDGTPDLWEYRVVSQGDDRFVELDDDFDGRIDRFLYSSGGQVKKTVVRDASRGQARRHLILCIDGVPFEVMNELWQQGHFRGFFPPKRVISTFPSDTDVALSTLYHAPNSPGYENRYFDRRENRIRGGITVTLKQEVPYHRLLDYDFPGLLRGPSYVLPERAFFDDLARLRKQFLQSKKSTFSAHLATTDVLFHVRSLERIRRCLIAVDALLRELLYLSDGDLEITFLSDHGNSLTPSQRVKLEEFLEASGYRTNDRLGEPRTVVIPGYGLIGTVAIYAQPEEVADLARRLVELEGVDFSVRREGETVIIESKDGQAPIAFDPGRNAFRYERLEGDPLKLASILERLKSDGKQESDGFIRQSYLFEATATSHYPDALRRIYECFANHVENKADLMLSLEDGYYFGWRPFEWFVEILSTHGSLNAGSSVGFIMSTRTRLPDALPLEEALR